MQQDKIIIEQLTKEAFYSWKKLCLKNLSCPMFMFAFHPQRGIDVFVNKDVSQDAMIATMKEVLHYWENQPKSNSKLIQL